MEGFKKLIVWQKSFLLTREIYQISKKFPKSERYNLTSQLRRSAISVPSNIAEGYCRGSKKEYAQFIKIAFASGAELETQLLLAKALDFADKTEFNKAESLLDEVMRMLNVLLRRLKDD